MAAFHLLPSDPAAGPEDWRDLARHGVPPATWPDPADHPVSLAVRHRERNGVHVLELIGESDIATVPALEAALLAAVPAPGSQRALFIDVSALTFCDVRSATLVLEASRAGRTSLTGAKGVVKRVFDLVDTSHAMVRCDDPPWATPSA